MIASSRHPWPRHVATLSHHERHHGCDDGRHHVRHHVRHHLLAWNDSNEGALSNDGIPVFSRFFLDLQTYLWTSFTPIDAAPERMKPQRSAWRQIKAFLKCYPTVTNRFICGERMMS